MIKIRPINPADQGAAYRIWRDGICGRIPVEPMTTILARKVPVFLTFIATQVALLNYYDASLIANVIGALSFYTCVWAFVAINQRNVIHFRTDMMDIHAHYGAQFMVAINDDNGQVVGTVAYQDIESCAKTDYLKSMRFKNRQVPSRLIRVHSLSVDKDCRGKGIGRKLMDIVVKIADKERAAILATTPESHYGAHALYRKLGFDCEEYFMADDEVNIASTGRSRNLIERYYLRLKMKKFIRFYTHVK